MEMAPHSSPLAWKIPCTEEPDRLESTGSRGTDTTEVPKPQKQGWGSEC